jgi:hypothetical protein
MATSEVCAKLVRQGRAVLVKLGTWELVGTETAPTVETLEQKFQRLDMLLTDFQDGNDITQAWADETFAMSREEQSAYLAHRTSLTRTQATS